MDRSIVDHTIRAIETEIESVDQRKKVLREQLGLIAKMIENISEQRMRLGELLISARRHALPTDIRPGLPD